MKIEAEKMSTDLSRRLRDALRTQAAARLLRSLQEPEKIFRSLSTNPAISASMKSTG